MSNLYYTTPQLSLAETIVENSALDRVFFCNSGAESNEAAIKCARKYASERGVTDGVIITANNSFHGRTLATISATGQPKYHKGFTYGGEMVKGWGCQRPAGAERWRVDDFIFEICPYPLITTG